MAVFASSTTPSARKIVGRKRRRGHELPPVPRRTPNGSVLDMIPELDEDIPTPSHKWTLNGLAVDLTPEKGEKELMLRTLVVGFGDSSWYAVLSFSWNVILSAS